MKNKIGWLILILIIAIPTGYMFIDSMKYDFIKKDMENYVASELMQNNEYIKSYSISGKYSSQLNISAFYDFDNLSIEQRWNVLKPMMDKFKEKNKSELQKYNKYKKALNENYQVDFRIATLKNQYSYDKTDSFVVNGKVYLAEQIPYVNTPIFNPEPKSTVTTSISYDREPSDEDKAFAWTAALQEIKGLLKAPRTAKFPFSYLNEYIKEVAPDTFVVKSYVDAENSFGAMIRTYFTIKIEKTGENSYKVLDIQTSE